MVVPALLGAVLALPAVASPEVAPVTAGATAAALLRGADGPGSPAVRVEGPAGPARGVVDALTAVRRHADTGAWLRSTAAAVQAAQGPIGGLRPLLLEPEADVEPVESEPLIDDFAVADRGGDLDGDGLEDVLAFTSDAEDDVLQARRGTDGGLLWSIALSEDAGALAFPVGRDLTGDGVDDLLLQYMVQIGRAHV